MTALSVSREEIRLFQVLLFATHRPFEVVQQSFQTMSLFIAAVPLRGNIGGKIFPSILNFQAVFWCPQKHIILYILKGQRQKVNPLMTLPPKTQNFLTLSHQRPLQACLSSRKPNDSSFLFIVTSQVIVK